jgi:hypothetical protein
LNNTQKELEEAKRMIDVLQRRKNMEDVPGMDNERVRLAGAEKVTELDETDKRFCTAYVNWAGKLIRKKIANDGKASIKFFILGKRNSIIKERLIPVNFKVNFNDMTTSLVLDEGRI